MARAAARGHLSHGVGKLSADCVQSGLGCIRMETVGIIPRTELSTALRVSQLGHRASAHCLQRRRERGCAVWGDPRENPGRRPEDRAL